MDYTSTTLVSNYLQRALTSNETTLLSTLIPAIKLFIDQETDSNFSSATPTTRYYRGGGRTIDIEPCQNITSVQALDLYDVAYYTYVIGQDYVIEPANDTVKREIIKRYGCFESGERRIAVTATFTEYINDVPADIKMVATRLAAVVISNAKIVNQGNLSRESLEGHEVMYNSAAMLNDAASSDPFIRKTLEQRSEIMVE
jgi:hypothetical protein